MHDMRRNRRRRQIALDDRLGHRRFNDWCMAAILLAMAAGIDRLLVLDYFNLGGDNL